MEKDFHVREERRCKAREIGDRLKSRRKERGLTQLALAAQIGCSNVTICQFEKGYNLPTDETLAKFAAVFETTVDYLRDGPVDLPTPLPPRSS